MRRRARPDPQLIMPNEHFKEITFAFLSEDSAVAYAEETYGADTWAVVENDDGMFEVRPPVVIPD